MQYKFKRKTFQDVISNSEVNRIITTSCKIDFGFFFGDSEKGD